MQKVINRRLAGWGLAALMTLTAAGGSAAMFAAGGPGEHLTPLNGAELLVSITQTQESILWSSLAGNVSTVEVVGWPSTDGIHDLGGALMLDRPDNPLAGAIRVGEPPATAQFAFGD